jgi:uncharacterized protein (DUF2267 family)
MDFAFDRCGGTIMDPFSKAKQKADEWLSEIAEELSLRDRAKALLALRAGLHALRDRLTPDEAIHLGAQLPMVIRGLYYEGWTPHETPIRVRSKEGFLRLVERPFHPEDTSLDPERIARAVLNLLSRHITEGEIADVKHILPRPIEQLWAPEP